MGSWRYKLIILLFFRLNKPTFFCDSLFVLCSSSQFVWWPFTRLIAVCWYLSCFTLPQTVHSSAQAASQMPEGDGVITYLDLLADITEISLIFPSVSLTFIAIRAIAHSSLPLLFPGTFSVKLLFTQSAPGCLGYYIQGAGLYVCLNWIGRNLY